MRNEIILLSGKAGAGKDTLADLLIEIFSKRKSWDAIKVSFALPIYQCHNLVVTRLQECGEYARKNRAVSWDESRKTHLSETDLDLYAEARKFDLELNTAQWNPGMCAELVTAQIDKNVWKEKRK